MATVALTISVIVFVTQQQRFRERENERNRGFNGPLRPDERDDREALDLHLQAAAHLWERGGKGGLHAYLQRLEPGALQNTLVFQGGKEIFAWHPKSEGVLPLAQLQNLARRSTNIQTNAQLQTSLSEPYLLGARKTSGGFVLAATWNMRFDDPRLGAPRFGQSRFESRRGGPDGPNGRFRRRPPFGGPFGFLWDLFFAEPSTGIQALRLLVVLCATGLVCYGLVRHLTTPIFQLRAAAKSLAEGDLSTRVATDLGRRQDELGVLGRDFDQMAERLEDLVAAQNRLIADISHELRSPLARVNVALELVRNVAGPAAEEDLDRIALETERLNTMIGQLLTLSRLESGEPLAEKTPVNLANLIESIATDADFEANSHNRAVKIIKSASCQTSGSETLLRSAIENVVRNAGRYTQENSAVEISLEKANGFALIRVRDYGPGVPQEALPHLFQPFYRITDARERTSGGTGLGLSIAERAVRFHGGTIEASNTLDKNGETAGFLMEIRLPLA